MKQQLSFFDQSTSYPSSPQSLPPRGFCRKQAGGAREGGCWVSESEEENCVLEKIGAESRGGDSARNRWQLLSHPQKFNKNENIMKNCMFSFLPILTTFRVLLIFCPMLSLAQWTTSGTTITGQVGTPGALTVDLKAVTAGDAILALSPNSGGIGIIKVNNYGSANPLAFQTSSFERMRIDQTGKVGIGTASPTAQLQINSLSASTIGQIVRGASAQTSDLQQWQNNAGSNLLRIDPAGNIRTGAADQYLYGFNANSYINLYNSTTGQIDIKGLNNTGARVIGSLNVDGSVGLAADQSVYSSNSSGALIKLYDAVTGQLYIRASTIQASFSKIRMQTGTTPTDRLLIDENGQVGIGTTTPSQKLEVAGAIYANGNASSSLTSAEGVIFRNAAASNSTAQWKLGIGNPGNYDNYFIGHMPNSSRWLLVFPSGEASFPAGAKIFENAIFSPHQHNNSFLRFNSADKSVDLQAWQTAIKLNVNFAEVARITPTGLGIGKTNPAYPLDVNGTINATNILINGFPIGGAFSGTAGQVPFVNETSSGYIGSAGLKFSSATNQFITGNNNSAPSGSNTFTSGDENVNKGLFGSAMFGELSEIDVNVGAAIAGGEGVYIGAYGGHSMGRGTAIRPGAYYSYSGGWWEPGSTKGKTNLKVPQVSGTSSFGYYSTDPSQIDNHGVRANSSAILGGKNSDIPPGSHYSVVLGGLGIKARDNDPQQVYVPNLNIVTAPVVNNALTQVVVRDATTGQLKSRDASTLSQWVTSSSGINYPVGAVGIGTPLTNNPNGYTLAVNGKIGAKDVQVETASTTWPDYVFAKDYHLPSLTEVEKYIQENKHLENVPSAKEIEKNGHSLGEMDKILLKKVEELTLYVIQQQKEIEELKKKLERK